jgi:hypothetical protein
MKKETNENLEKKIHILYIFVFIYIELKIFFHIFHVNNIKIVLNRIIF